MADYLETLSTMHRNIESLEEEHNSIMDKQAELADRIHGLDEELQEEVTRLKNDIVIIRRGIHDRINKAKRATVILGLLAQKEELRPIQTRVDKQPYEYYATSDWFVSVLQDTFSSSKSDS